LRLHDQKEARVIGDETVLRRKAEVLRVLRRAGVPEETVRALDDALDDPVDLQRDGNLFLRYGITRDWLIGRMGGSP
jgi:hypothetical protein